jgi:Zn-dependent peptidase ImmA (M78 family)/transcriptional regulator with XRE-family HTH domain
MLDVFVPARLEMARRIRGMTASGLADLAGITPEWVSLAENEKKVPSPATVREFSRVMDFPFEFFYRPVPAHPPVDAFHFRATSRLAKKDEATARALSIIAMELASWINGSYKVPPPAVPEIQDLADAEVNLAPETVAESVRNSWGLGSAPIPNLMQVLEAKGAKIFSAGGPLKAIDAFSFRDGQTPVIFLNIHKSPERLRFDLAHELGHLVMHGGSLGVENGKAKEQAANDFASAFLMPRSDVVGTVRGGLLLEDVLRLKSRWRVSAMALTFRVHRLGIVSDWTYSTLARQLSSAGFRSSEPGSDLAPESSSLLTQLMDDLRSQGKGFLDVARVLDIRAQDVRDLMLGLVTFGLPGEATIRERSRADLRAVSNE